MTIRADLTGRTFGRWTVQGPVPSAGAGPKTKQRCICSCGAIADVRTSHLLAGESTSCGCQLREKLRQRRPWARRNLKGRRIGRLLVLRPSATNLPPTSRSLPGGATAWFCRCDCGREVILATRDLTRKQGPASDCGCSRLKPAATPAPATATPVAPRLAPVRPMPLRTTSSAEALRAHHDATSGLGNVRRIDLSEDDEAGGVLHDFDPYN